MANITKCKTTLDVDADNMIMNSVNISSDQPSSERGALVSDSEMQEDVCSWCNWFKSR